MKIKPGINTDTLSIELPSGTLVGGRNFVYNKSMGTVSSEDGFTKLFSLDTNYVGHIQTPIESIVFTYNTNTDLSAIYRVKESTPTLLLIGSELRFNVFRPIMGDYEYNQKGELVICWWEGNDNNPNPPRVLNVDCLPFNLNPDKTFINPADVYLLDLNTRLEDIVTTIQVEDQGGDLKSGGYFIFIAYVFNDGSTTNYFIQEGPFYIYNSRFDEHVLQIEGSVGTTNKSIRVRLSNLNTAFYGVKIGIASINESIWTYYETDTILLAGDSINYSIISVDDLTPTTFSNLTIPGTVIKSALAGTVINNQLHFMNYVSDEAPDLQPYINNAQVKWNFDEQEDILDFPTSSVNPNYIVTDKVFRTNEVYALFVIVTMITGNKYTYHLPGRAVAAIQGHPAFQENANITAMLAGGEVLTDSAEVTAMNIGAKYFQIYNTARSDGTMGFWENQDEFYPNTDCSKVFDADGNEVGDLGGQRIRHHRTPDIGALIGWGKNPSATSNAIPYVFFRIVKIGWNGSRMTHSISVDNTDGRGSFSEGNGIYTADSYLWVSVEISGFTGDYDIYFRYSYKGERVYEEKDGDADSGYYKIYYLALEPGDYLDFEIRSDTQDNPPANAYIEVQSYNLEEVGISMRKMGLIVSNLNIPSEIAQEIAYYQIGYATRDNSNCLVFNQTLSHLKYIGDEANPKKLSSHAFDSLYYKPAPTFDYIMYQLEMQGAIPYVSNPYTPNKKIRYLTEGKYVPSNHPDFGSGDTQLDNSHLEATFNTSHPFPDNLDAFLFGDMMYHRTNVYFLLHNQKVTAINKRFSPSLTTTGVVYGGDIYLSFYAYRRVTNVFNSSGNSLLFFHPVESITNIGLRHNTEREWPLPKQLRWKEGPINDEEVTQVEFLAGNYQDDTSLEYNDDYNKLLNFLELLIFDCDESCNSNTSIFQTRVARSLDNLKESSAIQWRKFLPNDYYDMPRNSGEGIRLDKMSLRVLIIHMKHDLYVAQVKDSLQSDQFTVALGTGDLFATLPDKVYGSGNEGAGIQGRWAGLVTKYGYFFIDQINGRIFQYNVGQPAKDITMAGIYRKVRSTKDFAHITTDNPGYVSGYCLGFDDEYDRLLITKVSRSLSESGEFLIDTNDSWTRSYYPIYGAWGPYHDYYPAAYIFNRSKLYSIVNDSLPSDRKLHMFLHNVAGIKGEYHTDSVTYAWYVDIVFVPSITVSFKVLSVNWLTQVRDISNNVKVDSTFTSIKLANDRGNTGTVLIESGTGLPVGRNTTRKSSSWYFNAAVKSAGSWIKKGHIEGPYIVVTLTYDNNLPYDVYLIDVGMDIRVVKKAVPRNIETK